MTIKIIMKKTKALILTFIFIISLAGCGGDEPVTLADTVIIYDAAAPEYFYSLSEMMDGSAAIFKGSFGGFEDEELRGSMVRGYSFEVDEAIKGECDGSAITVKTRYALMVDGYTYEDGRKVELSFAAPYPWHFEPEEGAAYLIFVEKVSEGTWQPSGYPWLIRLGWLSAKLCALSPDGEDISVIAQAQTDRAIYQKAITFAGAGDGMPSDFLDGMGRRQVLKVLSK